VRHTKFSQEFSPTTCCMNPLSIPSYFRAFYLLFKPVTTHFLPSSKIQIRLCAVSVYTLVIYVFPSKSHGRDCKHSKRFAYDDTSQAPAKTTGSSTICVCGCWLVRTDPQYVLASRHIMKTIDRYFHCTVAPGELLSQDGRLIEIIPTAFKIN
jgi:hypothetical protein